MDYNKVFKSGMSELCRADLESLPCPFCTDNVTDEQMQSIVNELEVCMLEWYEWGDNGDITEDRVNEVWWENLERIVCNHGVPYYEDID